MKQSPQISDIMSAAIPALRWPLILAAGLVLVVPSSPAQTAFIHDSSGNLTNVVSSSSASPTGIVPAIGQTVSLGDPLSLSVAGSGSGILAYQWRLNGNNISGATSATYFLGSASATDSGIYTVVITSSGGSVTNQVGTISVFPTTNSLYGIAYGSGKYIAVGDKGTIATSSDSYIWTLASSGTTNRLEALAFQGGKFVVVGEKGTILTSTNGTQWFPATSNNTNDFKGIAYGNGTYVVVGAKGTTLTSPDAIAWTTRSYDNPTLNGVAFAAGRFVLVGTSGSIWHSTNGASWLVRDWPTNVMLNAITYANSNYVAVGAKGVVLTSADANAWTQRAVTTSQDFESVVRFTDAFSEYVIAIGPPGAAFHSPNGTLWSASDSSTFEFLYGCVASNSLAVAVGRNGTIVRIPHWQTHHFEWASISSPQLVGQSFPVTVMAKDAADNLIYNNSGSASISAFSLAPASSNVLIGNVAHSTFATGTTNNNFTAGFSFTPRSDLTVTHVRHYFGGKISFWDENKNILAQLNVSNAPASWISTPLPDPLVLKAGKTYIIATYSQAGFYYRLDGSNTFSDGVLNQALIATIDAFPEAPYAAFWPLVDFSYSTRKSQQVSCSPSNIVFNGTMTQTNVTVNAAGDTIVLRVTDAAGHEGTSTPFSVYAGNTVGIVASASPSPASYQAPLVYSATLGNSGPQTATNVVVYDILPPGVTFVSANSSAGGCSVLNNVVECFIGNLTNKQTAWISVTVTPTVAGVVLTNTLQLNCSCQNFYPQYGGVQQLTYVPPRLIAANANVQEGNLGLGYVNGYPVTLSSTSTLAVRFSVSTAPVTAAENSDFVGLADRVFAVMPGSTTGYVTFGIQGDTIQESNETFLLKFSNPVNASLTTTQATITILNDDGIAGNVSSLSWNTLFSPKRINSAFAITNIARDSSNNIATNFSGNVLWRVANLSSSTNTLLTNDIHFASDNLGTYTLGYQFSVTTNLFVTHVRHYFGSKVSIWNDGGLLLASANVQGTPGEWSETQLSTPVFLQTNHFYRIGVYTAGEAYFWNIDSPSISKYGRIYGSLYSSGDTFPEITDAARWYMVDLRYTLPGAVSPSVSGNFSSGVLNTNLSLAQSGTIYMMADDTNGHAGFSIPVMVLESNDLALLVQYSPSPALVNTNLTLSISVLNSGPNSSSGIKLTNWLPANASLVSATAAQGTVTQTNGIVTWNLTSLASLSSATLTIVLAPTVAGLPLTNLTQVVRTESESNTNNNTVSLVVIPDFSINSQMASGGDFSGSTWRSAGTKLWFSQTNTTHDGIDALQSGAIAHSQQSWVETTVRGPGNLSFWWKVSSESGGDALSFIANGATQTSISGEVNWQQRAYTIPAGLFSLRWSYVKDASINAGTDAAWLDQVVYTLPPFFFTNSTYSNYQFRTTLRGTNGQRLILQDSSDLIRWTSFHTNTMPGLTTNLIINPPTNAPLRFYRAVHRND